MLVRLRQTSIQNRQDDSMFQNDSDDQYTLKSVNRTRHQILWLFVAFLIIALVWAYYSHLDEATVAEGRVIPSKRVQITQSLEGGIVRSIAVREGQHVDEGQILVTLDDTKPKSELNELNIEIEALELQLHRLRAEIDGNKFVVTDEEKSEISQDAIIRQQQLYDSRQREYQSLQQQKQYTEKELKMSQPLLEKGAVSNVEILHLQKKLSEVQHQIDNFTSETLKEYRESSLNLSKMRQRKVSVINTINNAKIRSPIDGIVTQVHKATVGSVIKPGEDIVEIVPKDDALIVEAEVRPADIGFIHPGQQAKVKITAFDYVIYGGLDAVVTHVSADSHQNEDGEHFYEVWVKTDKNYLIARRGGRKLTIIPGMMATVDIITGSKSVLDYLLNPILRAKNNALRER